MSLGKDRFNDPFNTLNPDIIALSGEGVDTLGHITPFSKDAADCAAAIHKNQNERSIIVAQSAYSANLEPLRDDNGHIAHDSGVTSAYLISLGVEKIAADWFSKDTCGDAMGLRQMCQSVKSAKPSILLIAPDFHIERVALWHRFMFSLSPAIDCNMRFISIASAHHFSCEGYKARCDKETQSRNYFKTHFQGRYQSFVQLQDWLVQHHKAYNGEGALISDISPALMESYRYPAERNQKQKLKPAAASLWTPA